MRSWQYLPKWCYYKVPIFVFVTQEHLNSGQMWRSNIHKGSDAGTVDAHGKAMTASNIVDIAGTWCNKFCQEQPKVTLKDVQFNPKSNFNLFSIEKAIKEGWKL